MGYYTRHELTIKDQGDETLGALDIIADFINLYEEARYALEPDGSCADSVKWYSADNDLKEFSKRYPSAIFELSGEGEEAGDLWKLYAKNGKAQLCKAVITYPPFDEDKLE